jgi:hypothetical protein
MPAHGGERLLGRRGPSSTWGAQLDPIEPRPTHIPR